MNMLKRLVLICIVMFAFVGCDQSTKLLASKTLAHQPVTSYAGDMFRLQYTENTGVFLGVGEKLSDQQRFLLFQIFVTLILLGIIIFALIDKKADKTSIIAFSLILGGGVSNLYDRIVNGGAVVDFMNMGIGPLRTGIFNMADVFIMLGAAILFIDYVYNKRSGNKTISSYHH